MESFMPSKSRSTCDDANVMLNWFGAVENSLAEVTVPTPDLWYHKMAIE
jgi:hypothetical protein